MLWITWIWRPCGRASTASGGGFDLAEKERQIAELEERSAAPDLWNNPQEAQSIMQRLTRLKGELDRWHAPKSKTTTLTEQQQLPDAEDDDSCREEITPE